MADQSGAVALEMPFVYAVVIFIMLLPLADLAVAGFRYISAWEALRAVGQAVQYSPPSDFTDTSSWVSKTSNKADPAYPIPKTSIQLICGDSGAVCSAANTISPKYYSYTTTVTLSPIILRSVLCTSGAADPCTFTLSYSQRFQ
ncbi:hypothetical protein J2R76_002529 [Bradyrhizobium sp. USDA 4532]|uniref:hypothetical protein n=1 Tax=unclassified Bradyrhizobium TaxID=2631580 RepID=UPI00209D1698|nr:MULTISPECIES: hypothetical protein [unclassified Bradyrhizobium]MCP1834192.1 hypothetical protein [Bradyrhizobium sp. USDA 4545]MCP1918938.1 hypothetical protein [Bradyrhizobium sp. USDA 4532]